MPAPLYFRVIPELTWKNGSKTFPMFSAGMPIPVSEMKMRRARPSGMMLSVTAPSRVN